MKSNNTLIVISLLSLALAVLTSVMVWGEIMFPVKIGMYAFGFATGVAAGALIVKRRNQVTD
jgi:hypothetical protein